MNYSLAVAAPDIGVRSETFIRRHMEDLLPGATVVLTHNVSGSDAGHWSVDAPFLVCRRLAPKREPLKRVLQIAEKPNIRRFLKQHQVQVILGEFLEYSFGFFQLAQEFNIPYFAHAHGCDVSLALRSPRWQRDYLGYHRAAGIITVSNVARRRLIDLGLEAKRIHTIPCGIDVPNEPIYRTEREIVRCLAVGRMVPKKAPILLLEAFCQAVDVCPELRLDYIGTGDLLPAVRQFIEEFSLSDKVTLHGSQPHETVQQLMKEADIFLQHSVTAPNGDEEGLPVAILEAMGASLPVVSTRHAGIPEAVSDQTTGFLIDEGDCSKMAQRIVELAQCPELRIKMGFAGWQQAKEKFTWEKEKDSLLQIMNLA
jgi:colanic acid/amylovoran biosynthesis glycosyltransferase